MNESFGYTRLFILYNLYIYQKQNLSELLTKVSVCMRVSQDSDALKFKVSLLLRTILYTQVVFLFLNKLTTICGSH